MAKLAKFLQGVAGVGGAGLNVEEVFSTYLYDGTGSAQTITNGIDLAGEGGLVWIKERDATSVPVIYDTERGVGKLLRTNDTNAETDLSASSLGITAYNSNGFSLGGTTNNDNDSGINHASWTFRKAPKFFDVVTATSIGSTSRVLSHNLGCDVGFAVVKRLDSTSNWISRHRSLTAGHNINLNTTQASFTFSGIVSFDSTTITINEANFLGTGNYVVYLFAHNDGDGDFGPTGDQDIIKCGSYTGNGSSTGPSINLGFEPQWLLIKGTSAADSWAIFDVMRGMTVGASDSYLFPNSSGAELSYSSIVKPTPTGFQLESVNWNSNGNNYIYIAIRRGPMAVPTDATDVFGMDFATSSGAWTALSGFPIDFLLYSNTTSGSDKYTFSRLNSPNYMRTNLTNGEAGYTVNFDRMDGIEFPTTTGDYSTWINWMWKRAPNFFDVVAWEGSGTSGYEYVNHNLGVTPEMIWFKNRDSSATPRGNWYVYHKDLANSNGYVYLNSTPAEATDYPGWATGSFPFSDTRFVVQKSRLSYSGESYIAYLFASVDGVSKVGSFTGNGSSTGDSQDIDCGFSSGARFVLVKAISAPGAWFLFDTERGIVAGNDSHLSLNSTAAEDTSRDLIDPLNSGFTINYHSDWGNQLNGNGQTYIFYAIA